LREKAYIGQNSVVLEGAIVEEGAIIAPNSVVPPGRVVPSMQVWGGNPIKFIRYVKEQEAYVTS
jgi:carbonic anhydrase/acetyltransferase-like protein (isoleucine patch superfamily)